jgi:chromosome segregation ATPase
VRSEVECTQANFGDHRIRIIAASAEEMRQAAGVRIFNELLLGVTRELARADERRKELNVERAMLQARLRMLEHNESALLEEFGSKDDGDADPLAERSEMQGRLDELNAAMAQYGGGTEGLDRQLEIVRDALLSARELVRIETRRLRVDAMNTVLDRAQAGGQTIEFIHVQAPRLARAFAAVRLQRAAVPAGGLSISEVERTL